MCGSFLRSNVGSRRTSETGRTGEKEARGSAETGEGARKGDTGNRTMDEGGYHAGYAYCTLSPRRSRKSGKGKRRRESGDEEEEEEEERHITGSA